MESILQVPSRRQCVVGTAAGVASYALKYRRFKAYNLASKEMRHPALGGHSSAESESIEGEKNNCHGMMFLMPGSKS